MKDVALVITPYNKWGITTAMLYHTTLLGAMVETRGIVTADNASEEISVLLSLLQKVQPLTLYELAGRKVFRTPALFWEKADKTIQKHVKKVCDQRLAELIRKASVQDIPIFYRQTQKDILRIENQLSLSPVVPHPRMAFARTDDGIQYSLTLNVNDDIVVPSEHSVDVITATPGIISVDNNLYILDERFNGKLLMPFREKKTTFIPQRMEREYFQNFILRNVATAEVEAKGFELTDIHLQPLCRLARVADVLGNNSLTIEYIYGSKTFPPSDKATCHVTLEETDDGFRFLRIQRDGAWEKQCRECLEFCTESTDGCTLYDDVIRFASFEVMIDWMKCYGKLLRRKGFGIEQPSDETYYIGTMDLRENVKEQGDWLMLHSDIVLEDGRTVPFLALRDTILQGQKTYTMPDGTRLIIPDEWLRKYTPFIISGMEEGTSMRIHKTLYQEAANTPITPPDSGGIAPITDASPSVPLPKDLHATLRPYQETGYQWLANHLATKHGCCLGDDMGLGKTIQTIALFLHYKEITTRHKPTAPGMLFAEEEMRGESSANGEGGAQLQYVSLVIAPTSLVHNWQRELKNFAPSLSVMAYTGSPEDRRKKRQNLSSWDVVITTYRTLANDIRLMAPLQYGVIVFDESQAFKNHDSQIHKAVSMLQGQCRIALSGTPVENGIDELWSLFHVIQPSLLGTFTSFSSHYLSSMAPSLEAIRTETLRRIISPYMLKRKKEEVLCDLPERQDELVICPMSPEQESLYVTELSQARNSVMDEQNHQSINVLTAIQRLRQIACHPALVTADIPPATIPDASASVEGGGASSGKMDEVLSRLENLRGTGHKVLLFSEYVGFLKIISHEMSIRDWKHSMLTGETLHREQVIADFQNDDDNQFFLISLKAGGVGLNLTQADYVFILDPWWNRAAEEQAISRSHRIGQRNAVFVYRFVSEGTLEEQVLTLQNDKQQIIDKVLFC